ncbi:MAG: hypothetical protein A3G75_02885 [Verrucomicrobia bacterium RIFCSPLOWO2_12_FULL_64_8]|nr:MAG: hypothetical protein A3G75_02885 [Verrucomicrobia bacterium RIFCSPLOWO2_12_FULL_64_8]
MHRPIIPIWIPALMVALACVAGDAARRMVHIQEVSGRYGETVDAPAVDPRSSTGYADGRRSVILIDGTLDGDHWIMQTQLMFARGEWRLRKVDYDNAPRGREVHWASPYHWWLTALAWLDHAVSGRPIGLSVERAALMAGPLLLGLALMVLIPFVARRFGDGSAALLAIGMVWIGPFYTTFVAGYADHHGAAQLCALLTLLGVLAGGGGFVRDADGRSENQPPAARNWPPDRRTARRWFIFSGVAGGLGMWISAASQIPVLVGVGAGALWAGWLGRMRDAPPLVQTEPRVWRWWGIAGAVTSTLAYLIEYFPSHLPFRLEVNHPLYAVAWLGAGVLLQFLVLRLHNGWRGVTRREIETVALAVFLVALPPAVLLVSGGKLFAVADPFSWRLSHAYVEEGLGLGSYLWRGTFDLTKLAYLLPVLALLPVPILLCRRGLPQFAKAQLALAAAPVALFLAMAADQIRWWSTASTGLLALIVILAVVIQRWGRPGPARHWWRGGGILLFLPAALVGVGALGGPRKVMDDVLHQLTERDVAHWLRQRVGEDPLVVLGSPGLTTTLCFFGGGRGVGTLYWENREGLGQAAEIYAADSPAKAREMMHRHGITHIVINSWDAFEGPYVRLARGLGSSDPLPADAFIFNLMRAPLPPPWLRPIPFKIPDNAALKDAQLRIWEVTEPMTTPQLAVAAVNYFLEMGQTDRADQLEPILARFADNLPATVMRAGIVSRRNDAAAFTPLLERIGAQLPQAALLSLEDHIHLVVVLAVGRRVDLARKQLEGCVGKVDEPSLRRLTPGTLADLLTLCQALKVPLPGPNLAHLAEILLPPNRRR